MKTKENLRFFDDKQLAKEINLTKEEINIFDKFEKEKMIKIYKFKIGEKYKGFVIKIGWFKFERIGFKYRFLWRFEFSNWGD